MVGVKQRRNAERKRENRKKEEWRGEWGGEQSTAFVKVKEEKERRLREKNHCKRGCSAKE